MNGATWVITASRTMSTVSDRTKLIALLISALTLVGMFFVPEVRRILHREGASPPKNPLDETSSSSSYYRDPDIGISFQYPSYLVAERSESKLVKNWITIYPKRFALEHKKPSTTILISWAFDHPEWTAEQWLNSRNSLYDPSKQGPYRHRLIGGQDAVVVINDGWAVVKSPENNMRFSIAFLTYEEEGAAPLRKELYQILDSFSFDSNPGKRRKGGR